MPSKTYSNQSATECAKNTKKISTNLTITNNIVIDEMIISKEGKTVDDIVNKCFGSSFDPKKKYVICIQGSSSSGKSTLALNLYNIFNEKKISCFLLELDRFYKTLTDDEMKKAFEGEYDFDNPGSIDWEKIHSVLRGIHNDEEYLDLYEYNFAYNESKGPIKTVNIKPTVIIIEGIYSFNIFNELKFNDTEFCPLNSHKIIENEFVKQDHVYNSFNILKIKMSMCKSKCLQVRVARDVLSRGRKKEYAIKQFEKHVWPAIEKWGTSENNSNNFTIIHGTFNESKVKILIDAFTNFFMKDKLVLDHISISGDFSEYVKDLCSGECNLKNSCDILMKDD